ncbi:MAG TPA: choice-of-anchor tandem repeat GloVer-containing protein [Rhizomicrobium sp.]|nr:choice-of-anchor tandem repeat GloVer-containing protein [Rhizomicrobium sp.]
MSSTYTGTFQLTGSLFATDGETATISGGYGYTLSADLDANGNGTLSSQSYLGTLNFIYLYQGTTQYGTLTFQIPAIANAAVTNGSFSTFVQVPSSDPNIHFGITLSGTFSPDQTSVQENFAAVIGGTSQGYAISGSINGPGSLLLNRAPIQVTGGLANQTTLDNVAISPFQSVNINDSNPETSQTLTVTLQNPGFDPNPSANGTLTNLSGGTYDAADGIYTVTGTTAQATAALHALVFNPTVHQHSGGQIVTTNFIIGLVDNVSATGSSAVTSVKVTQTGPTPTLLAQITGDVGDWPVHNIAMDAAGNIFGVTELGGTNNEGAIFEIAKTADGYASTPTLLLASASQYDLQTAGVIVDADGNLISVTSNYYNTAALYEIAKTAGGYACTPTTLVTLPGGTDAGVTADADGNLYGMLKPISYPSTPGQIFKIAKTPGGYDTDFTIVAQLPTGDYINPINELLVEAGGNLFGTIETNSYGSAASIFEVAKTADGYGDLTVIASLSGQYNNPIGPLVEDKAGDLFGQTALEIFEIVKTASGYDSTPVTLATFATQGFNVGDPQGSLIVDARGDLFGAANTGGPFNNGAVFEIVKTANGYDPTPTIVFGYDGNFGIRPLTGVLADAAGNLYATSTYGIANGSVIKLQNSGYQVVSGGIFTGTDGNDVLQGTPDDDVFDGAGGNDTVSYSNATAGVVVNLSVTGPQDTVGAGSDKLISIENLAGSSYNDSLTGDAGNNVLSGGSGNDVLWGLGGSNVLDGGDGIDTAAYALSPWNYYVTVDGGGGYTVEGPGAGSAGSVTDTLTDIEQVSFDGTGQTLSLAQFAAQSFNPLQYIASYGDLIQAFGDDQQKGVQHFLANGYQEGRSPVAFNALQYIASYGDLITALGDNATAGYEHYIKYGYYEGRYPAAFNPLQYIASNPDLIASLGDNQTAATEQYILQGYAHGRTTGAFNALQYIASYGDLITALGANPTAGYEHFIKYGYSEGRNPFAFNALQYVASNPDLIASLGDNLTAAAQEYIQQGYAQGRPTSGFDPLEYIASYGDLITSLGDNAAAGYDHYIKNGYFEGRNPTAFNALEYLASNPDLALTYGSNTQAGVEQYIQHGYAQGRAVNTFDAVAYLLSYPDLQAAGLTAQSALLHYLNYGVKEGRAPLGQFGIEQTQHALSLGTQLSDTIGTAGDEDWFSVNLTAGQNYTLTLSGADSASGSLPDPRLELHSATGTLIASDNDSGPGKDALIHVTAPTTGTFYLLAAANFPSGTGTYKILAAVG